MRTVSDVSRCIGDRYIRGWCELRCEGNDLMWSWCAGCCWEVSGSVFCAEGVFKHSSSRSSSRHPSHQTSLHSHRYSRFLLYSSHHMWTELCCIAGDTAAIQQRYSDTAIHTDTADLLYRPGSARSGQRACNRRFRPRSGGPSTPQGPARVCLIASLLAMRLLNDATKPHLQALEDGAPSEAA